METTTKQDKSQNKTNRDQIASLAYKLWERGGRKSGRDLEYWLLAEKLLLNASQPSPTPQPVPEMRRAFANNRQGTRASGSGAASRAAIRVEIGRP